MINEICNNRKMTCHVIKDKFYSGKSTYWIINEYSLRPIKFNFTLDHHHYQLGNARENKSLN